MQERKPNIPSWMRKGILYFFRKPMTVILKRIESQIPKTALAEKHIRNLRMITDRTELLKLLPVHAVVAELGVDVGDFSMKILDICQPKKLHLVDFWGSRRYNEEKQKGVYKRFETQLKNNEVEINLGLSTDVVNHFADSYFDWIYIDTDHTYQTTRQELEKYRNKIKPGGMIAGHDYCMGNWSEMRRYGVIEAVHEFCVKYDWEMLYLTMDAKTASSFAIHEIPK